MQRSNIISGIIFVVLLVLGFYLWKGSPAELRYQSAAVADTQKPGAFTLQTPVVTCEGTLPRITLTWGESARASNYRVDRMYPWGGAWEEVGRTTTLSFTDMTFESGYDIGDFLYRVQARNTSGAIQTLSIPATVATCSIAVVEALPPPPSATTPLPIAPAPAPIVVPSPAPAPIPPPLPTPPPAPLPVVVPVPVPSPTLAPVSMPVSAPAPTPTPVPVVPQQQVSLFSIGNRILTTANLNVRSTPSTYARKIGTQPKGVAGSIVGGPISANGYIWWNVNFDSNADGWCIEKYYTLAPVGTPSSAPAPAPAPIPLPASPATPSSTTSTPPISVGTSSVSTLPSSASALLWGAYTGDTPSSLSAFETLVGKPVNMQAIFVGWGTDAPFPSEFGPTVRDKGKTLVIFWEPSNGSGSLNQPGYNYDSINGTAWDAYMTKFAADAKAYGGPVILVPFHEMNGNWDPWDGTVNGNSPTSFIAAWRKVRGIFSSASNVKFAWDINNDSVPDTVANRATAYWPGDAYVDYIGIDGFNFGSPWQTFSQMFDNAVSLVSGYNKPIYIFSIASADGAQKPAWITEALSVQIKKIPNIKGCIWFNVNKEQNWLVNSSAASLTAFKAVLP